MNGIAYFIRKRRRRVADVAELLGISEISCRFYLYYSPERVLTIQVRRIQKIAKILDVSIDDLLKSYDPAKLEAGDRAPVRSRTKRPEQNCVDRYRREKNITLEMLGKMMGVSRQAADKNCRRKTALERWVCALAEMEGIDAAEFHRRYDVKKEKEDERA